MMHVPSNVFKKIVDVKIKDTLFGKKNPRLIFKYKN